MKNFYKLIGIAALISAIAIFAASCGDLEEGEGVPPTVPQNVKLSIEKDRILVIEWDAFPKAQGYEIISQSVGCGSGNRIINTKDNTAFSRTVNAEGEVTIGTSSTLIGDHATPTTTDALVEGSITNTYNGRVEIINATKVKIVLMQENVIVDSVTTPDYNKIMASTVSVKVKALGTNPDTEFSETKVWTNPDK